MTNLFDDLLAVAVREVSLRQASYFQDFTVSLSESNPPLDAELATCAGERADAATAIREGIARYIAAGVRIAAGASRESPLARMLQASILDALAASRGRLNLRPFHPVTANVEDVLRSRFDEKILSDGTRYWIGRAAGPTLLLINAVGIPLRVWRPLLADASLRLRLCIVEPPCTDPLTGGMQSHHDTAAHACRLDRVLAEEHITNALALGWSNSARLTVHLCGSYPERIGKMVLLSPTFQGLRTAPPMLRKYQAQMKEAIDTIIESPDLADHLADIVKKSYSAVNWSSLAAKEIQRESRLLTLGAADTLEDRAAPFGNGASLLNYATSTAAEHDFPIEQTLARLPQPVLLITGRQDDLVNNDHTRACFAAAGLRYLEADVMGAGHYIHELQYHYLRYLLEAFAAGAPLHSCARVTMRVGAMDCAKETRGVVPALQNEATG